MEQSWNRLWKYVAAAAGCIVLGLLSFEGDAGVPLLKWIDLGVHESGHLATFWLPDVATAMAGSIAQVAVPLAIGTYFAARRRDLVGAALCLAWAGTSANAVSIYIADAPTEALPLAGGGLHDWAFLLGPEGFDAMRSAGTIASAVRGMGLVMVLIAVASCLAGPLLAAHLHAPGSVGASSADPASQGRPLTEPAQAREVEAPVAPAVAEEARAAAPARELEAVPAPEGPPRAA